LYDFEVESSLRRYRVSFTDAFEEALRLRLERGDTVIIDARVAELHRHRLGSLLDDPRHLRLDADERLKSYEGIGPIIGHLTGNGFRKGNKLIAIGGGITQDAVAFTASVLYRGVEWIFFPSTLLAQCDSCIGGKTSINFGKFKNQLGNFYPPSEIYIDLSLLETLPRSERLSGLGEMAHYFLVSGEKDFNRFSDDAPRALTDAGVLKGLIARSLEIKRGFIEKDEFDRKERQILNYGHSFGHALEAVTGYGLPHGIAVSYGMDIANFVSMKLGLVTGEFRDRVREVLSAIWREHPIGDISLPEYVAALRRDKKNAGATLGLILTRGFGRMFAQQIEVTDEFTGWLQEYFDNGIANA
jgi:3-dehydroquinate synthetase